jgi:hypothetical protein
MQREAEKVLEQRENKSEGAGVEACDRLRGT